MSQDPTQDEIDSIASFVEAVDELEKEPFFSKDEPRGISSGGGRFTYRLGDRFHFRSALITFRRIWMKRDAENFDRVCDNLAKFLGEKEPFLEYHRDQVQQIKNSNSGFVPGGPSIKNEKLIDLWLNTVFAHSGLRQQSKHSRAEFDKLVEDFGIGAIEHAFRYAIWSMGLEFFNIAKLVARPLLTSWRVKGFSPSFKSGSAFGTKRRERTPDGNIVIRQSSSEFFSEEAYEMRFARILERPDFNNLKSVLKLLDFSDRQLLYLSLKYESIVDILNQSDFEFKLGTVDSDWERSPQSKLGKGVRFFCGLANSSMTKRSEVTATDFEILTDEVGLEILNAQLLALREKLMKG